MKSLFKRLNDFEGVRFYRCRLCQAVVSPWDIKTHHGCPKCHHTRISPTALSFWEKMMQLIKHPAFWRWPDAV
jgi:hypothetical protein